MRAGAQHIDVSFGHDLLVQFVGLLLVAGLLALVEEGLEEVGVAAGAAAAELRARAAS